MLFHNDGTPVEKSDNFAEQSECAYQALSGVVDEMLRVLRPGAILTALTPLQLEHNGAMTIAVIEKMIERHELRPHDVTEEGDPNDE